MSRRKRKNRMEIVYFNKIPKGKSPATAGPFTRRMVSLMKLVMRRTQPTSNAQSREALKDVFIDPSLLGGLPNDS